MVTRRFAVDKMLGRLATWLRLLGYDTSYGSHLSGRTLIRHARLEGRTILTRDRRVLREARGVPLIAIAHDGIREQLRQVVAACGLPSSAELFSRCVRCNDRVVAVAKETVAGRVPPYVLDTQERFARCPSCRRIYWPGTHHDRATEQLRKFGLPPVPAA